MDKMGSSAITLLLAALLIGYLAIGKMTALGLEPRIMVVLATLTIAHGGWVIFSRCRFRWRQGAGPSRRAGMLEIVMLLGLLATLTLGLANYLLGFQGYLEIIPHGEAMPLGPNLQLMEQGVFSRPKGYGVAISNGEFVARGQQLRLRLESGGRATELLLGKGQAMSHAGLRLVYQGDGYLVALMVQRGNHDYLAAPLKLRQQPGSPLYRAALDLAEPGTSGEVTIDPATGVMTAKVERKGVTEFSGPLPSGQVATQGEMRLQVTASSHFGRLLVQHRNYRSETLAALGLFVLAGLARLLLGCKQRRHA